MKVTKSMVSVFEHDQKNKGTKVAISNVLWQLSVSLLNDLGVKQIKTTYFQGKGKK